MLNGDKAAAVRRKTGVPLVTLGLYVPRLEFEPPERAGLAALMVRSAVRGAGDLDAAGLAFAFERLGGTLSPTAASDWLGFGTTVLTEHLAEAAALLDQVCTAPRFVEADITTERDLMQIEAEHTRNGEAIRQDADRRRDAEWSLLRDELRELRGEIRDLKQLFLKGKDKP